MRKHTDEEVNARRERVIEAASRVFFRYGFARATIGDIATEAEIARPALYLLFPGKEELFDAALQRLVTTEVESYRAALPRFRTLRSKLLHCVERWSLGGLRLTTTHPDARDAFNMAYPAVQRMYDVLADFYAEILRDAIADAGIGMSPDHFARLLIFSLRGIKDLAPDKASLQKLLAQEVDIFLAALGSAAKH